MRIRGHKYGFLGKNRPEFAETHKFHLTNPVYWCILSVLQ